MKTTSAERSFTAAADAIVDLFDQSSRLGIELLEALSSTSGASLGRMWQGGMPATWRSGMPALWRMGDCGCDIPPPCWLPCALGEVTSHVCPGGNATLRLVVTNCGASARTITFDATAQAAVTFTPAQLTLAPMQRGTAVASVTVAATAANGEEQEILLWVRGCREHYLRWTVKAASRGCDSCYEVEVDDCPDLVHHWYDHFYCERGCPHGR